METIHLNGNIRLQRPDFDQFQKEFAAYVVFRDNRWFRQNMEYALGCVNGAQDIAWHVFIDGRKAGGVLLPGNRIICMFTLPWADGMADGIIRGLHGYLASQGHDGIFAQLSLEAHSRTFKDLGYTEEDPQIVMIRPTEKFELHAPEGYLRYEPDITMMDGLVALALESDNSKEFNMVPNTPDSIPPEIKAYFEITEKDGISRSASIVLRDKDGRIGAACLIAMWEGLPIIFDIWVGPAHRRKGLAEYMIKFALTGLHGHHPFVRLFVFYNNPARALYEKLDFLAGNNSPRFKIRLK